MSEYIIAKTHATTTLSAFRSAGISHVGTIPERVRKSRIVKDRKPGDDDEVDLRHQMLSEAGLEEVDVLTAGDENVCPICEDISDSGPYDLDTAEGLIPAHPACRCAFVPVEDQRFASVRDEEEKGDPFHGNQYTSGAGGSGLLDVPMRSQSINIIASIGWKHEKQHTEVLINPTERALLSLAKEDPEQSVRHLDDRHGNQFFWKASEAIHAHVQGALRFKGATGIGERPITGGFQWFLAKKIAPYLSDKLKEGRCRREECWVFWGCLSVRQG